MSEALTVTDTFFPCPKCAEAGQTQCQGHHRNITIPLPRNFSPDRVLSEGESASLEKVAKLRGYAGRLRAAIRKAHRILLQHEHNSPLPTYPVEALRELGAALDMEAP